MYAQLSQLSRIVLSLPHSNADTERTFSVLRKVQTDLRGNLKVKTINSVLSVKLNNPVDCHQYKPEMDLVKATKCACTNYTERLSNEKMS